MAIYSIEGDDAFELADDEIAFTVWVVLQNKNRTSTRRLFKVPNKELLCNKEATTQMLTEGGARFSKAALSVLKYAVRAMPINQRFLTYYQFSLNLEKKSEQIEVSGYCFGQKGDEFLQWIKRRASECDDGNLEKFREYEVVVLGEEEASEPSLNSCAICLCDLTYKDGGIHFLPCTHVFHLRCIKAWLLPGNSCPLCRRRYLV